jgi:hypothetical protein
VIFWVGLPSSSLLFGDVFRALQPVAGRRPRGRWLAAARPRGELPEPMAYPAWLGPLARGSGILAFAWVELVYHNRDDPSTLACWRSPTPPSQLVGMSLYGIESVVAPRRRLRRLLRALLRSCRRCTGTTARSMRRWLERPDPARPGARTPSAMLAVMIGTTSFDGLSQGDLWAGPDGLGQRLQRSLVDLGFSQQTALEIAFTIGWCDGLLRPGAVRARVRGMLTVGTGHRHRELRRRVRALARADRARLRRGPLLLAAGLQGQAVAYLASDPLGDGSDSSARRARPIDYTVITATGIWYVQVGRAGGSATSRGLDAGPRPRAGRLRPRARRDALAVLDARVMVGFTSWAVAARPRRRSSSLALEAADVVHEAPPR